MGYGFCSTLTFQCSFSLMLLYQSWSKGLLLMTGIGKLLVSTMTLSPCFSTRDLCPSKITLPSVLAVDGIETSIVEDSGMMTGLKERVEGAIGVMSMHGTLGATMAPPTARLYPVDPLGVLIMSPSP